jgi:NodT family efflux transporter outer membrane factor (OMF) lipoprotein
MKRILPGFSLIPLFVLVSCSPPAFVDQTSRTALPDEFGDSSAAARKIFSSQTAELKSWWKLFNDPVLNSLVERAVQQNLDIQSAEYRIREARARRDLAESRLLPNLKANASYSRIHISENGLPFGPAAGADDRPSANALSRTAPDTAAQSAASEGAFGLLPEFNLYQAGFDASWEADIFGRRTKEIAAASAQVSAAVEQGRDVLVSLLAEVARNYVELRGIQQELSIAESSVKTQREIAELTRNLKANGVATDFDVARAEAQMHFVEAEIPPLKLRQSEALYSLAMLLGQTPHSLDDELLPVQSLPPLPSQMPIGVPSDLIRRRPDIRKAEQDIVSAYALEGAARADLYPRFTLNGSFSFVSGNTDNLFDWRSRNFSVGPGISLPIFDNGARRAVVEAREQQINESLVNYQRVTLAAVKEVEEAISSFSTQQERRDALERGRAAQQEAVSLARELYKEGLSDFLSVLDAERELYTAQDSLAKSDTALTTSVIALYKALGGGWAEPEQKNE